MSMIASAYSYTKKLSPDNNQDETPSTIEMAEEIKTEPRDVGLRRICEDEARNPHYMQSMVGIHELMKSSKNIKEVRLENIENDFNGTMRSIFQHLAGNDPRVDLFIERASRGDLSRMPQERLDTVLRSGHVSEEREKNESMAVLQSMLEAGDPCVHWAAQMDERMGYNEGFAQ